MYSRAGKDAVSTRRDRGRYLAIRHADLRPVAVGSVPGRPDRLRNGPRECIERRRLQTAYAGHRVDRRHFTAGDAVRWIWRKIVSEHLEVLSFCVLGRAQGAPFSCVDLAAHA